MRNAKHNNVQLKGSRVESHLIQEMRYGGKRGGEGEGREKNEWCIQREKEKQREEDLQKQTERLELERWMGRENMNEKREKVFL